MCDKGHVVVFGEDKGVLNNVKTGKGVEFRRVGGAYVPEVDRQKTSDRDKARPDEMNPFHKQQ